jgi:hypothetical protein
VTYLLIAIIITVIFAVINSMPKRPKLIWRSIFFFIVALSTLPPLFAWLFLRLAPETKNPHKSFAYIESSSNCASALRALLKYNLANVYCSIDYRKRFPSDLARSISIKSNNLAPEIQSNETGYWFYFKQNCTHINNFYYKVYKNRRPICFAYEKGMPTYSPYAGSDNEPERIKILTEPRRKYVWAMPVWPFYEIYRSQSFYDGYISTTSICVRYAGAIGSLIGEWLDRQLFAGKGRVEYGSTRFTQCRHDDYKNEKLIKYLKEQNNG